MEPSEKSKMLAGELYDPSDPELSDARISCRKLLHQFNHSDPGCWEERVRILAELIPNQGPSLHIEPPFFCDYGANLHTGEEVYFNFDCVVLDVADVVIGDRVLIATKVQIITATHPVDAVSRNSGLEYGKSIRIGNDVWIGSGAIILPGITVGDRAVIGAGAVVTRDVPEDTIVAGNPARIVRKID